MKHLVLIYMLLAVAKVTAQLPTDFRSEQIYLNPDKHAYHAGDTINLEGQVACIAEERFLPYSRYLYVELFDEKDSVLIRQKISCGDKGFFDTRLPLEYEWRGGVYYLRAYTQLMRNFSPTSFSIQPILIDKEFPEKEKKVYEAKCAIVPSGGTLTANCAQSVTVWLADEQTYPIQAELKLLNEGGDTISSVRTSSSGLARLSFIPLRGSRYYLTGKIDGIDYRFPFPTVSTDLKIQASLNGRKVSYQLLNVKNPLSQYYLYTFDRINGLTELTEVKSSGIILLEKEPKSLSIFLTDDKHHILSEYALAAKYERREFLMPAADTLSLGDSLHQDFSSLSAHGTVMTRIVPENDLLASSAESVLYYLSDYASVIPFPRNLYCCQAGERNQDLQAWIQTARFKGFDLRRAIEKDTAIYAYMPEQTMAFGGWIEKKNKHPMKGGTVVAYHAQNDFVYDAPVDNKGNFRMAVDNFCDGESFFLQAIDSKGKPDFANFHLDDETYPSVVNPKPFRLPRSHYAETETTTEGSSVTRLSASTSDSVRNYLFPNITVKARLRAEEPPKETNAFYSVNFADREKIEERNYMTLYDILLDMPGVIVRKEEQNSKYDDGSKEIKWTVASTRGSSILHGNNSLPIIIDNAKFYSKDYDFILNMTAFEIESVELLRPWQTLPYITGAVHGAILIKTRDYKERPPLPSKGVMYTPTGLSSLSGNGYKGKLLVPDKGGRYRLMVDVFTENGVQSYEQTLVVVE